MPQNASLSLFYELAIFWSAKKRRGKDTFFFHPPSPFTVIFATATVLAFVLLRDSRFNFHCYTQREATPLLRNRPGSAALRPLATDSVLTRKITKRIHSSKPARLRWIALIYARSVRSSLQQYFSTGSDVKNTSFSHTPRGALTRRRVSPRPPPHTLTHIHNHVHAVAESSPTPNTLFSDSTSDDNHRSVPPASPTLPDRITWLTNSACFYYFYFLIKTADELMLNVLRCHETY